MRRFLAALAVVVVWSGCTGLLSPGPSQAFAQQDPASRALRFLNQQQGADGHVDGFDPAQGTEDYLLAAAAAGYDPNSLRNLASGRSGYDYLAAHLSEATSSAGRTGRLLMAVVAGGRSTSFAGVDLVARLETELYVPATGRYGQSDSFSQALAMLGLRSAGRTLPGAATAYLKGLQNADGSWYSGPVPAPPAPATQGDTNSTALALMALEAVPDHSRDTSALAFLHTQQLADGGFPYQTPSPYPVAADADSTGLVVQALLAAAQAPSFSDWTKGGGRTPYAWLTAAQDPASGGFLGFLGTPDAATTVQAAGGLALVGLPVLTRYGPGYSLCVAAENGVRALRYLAANQAADGHVDGFSSAQGTEDYILGATAAGYDPATLKAASGVSAYDFLAANTTAATATAGGTGRLLEAVVAGGRSAVFGGVDLVARLEAVLYNPASGRYGQSDAFNQALAMLGLEAAGRPLPAAAVTYLKNLQNSDGSWYFGSPPAPGGPATAGDTNNTAMALMALAGAGDHSRDAVAVNWLRGQQQPDGGFPYQAAFPPSDSDSTALVVQALVAANQEPAGWSVGGSTPFTYLAGIQLPGGGLPGFLGTADVPTTVAAVAGLERRPYPIRPIVTGGGGLDGGGPGAGVCLASPPPPSPPPPSPSAPPSPSPTPIPIASPAAVVPTTSAPSSTPSPESSPAPVAAVPSPSPETTPSPRASASPSAAPGAPPAAPGGGLPPLLLYGLAGLVGLAVAAGAGAAWLLRARR